MKGRQYGYVLACLVLSSVLNVEGSSLGQFLSELTEMAKKEGRRPFRSVPENAPEWLKSKQDDYNGEMRAIEMCGKESRLQMPQSLMEFGRRLRDLIEDFQFSVISTDQRRKINVSLKEMADHMREHHNIILSVTGGLIRDLAMQVPPNDVDIEFTILDPLDGEPMRILDRLEIEQIVQSALLYYFKSIGMRNEHRIEAQKGERILVKVSFNKQTEPFFNFQMDLQPRREQCALFDQAGISDQRENCLSIKGVFTLDSIEYNTQSRLFTCKSIVGLTDLRKKKLQIHPDLNRNQWFGIGDHISLTDRSSAIGRLVRAMRYWSTQLYFMDPQLRGDIQQRLFERYESEDKQMVVNKVCTAMCNLAKEPTKWASFGGGSGQIHCELFNPENYSHITDNLRRFTKAVFDWIGPGGEGPSYWFQKCSSSGDTGSRS